MSQTPVTDEYLLFLFYVSVRACHSFLLCVVLVCDFVVLFVFVIIIVTHCRVCCDDSLSVFVLICSYVVCFLVFVMCSNCYELSLCCMFLLVMMCNAGY